MSLPRYMRQLLVLVGLCISSLAFADQPIAHRTKWYGIELYANRPEVRSLWVDSLATGRESPNGIQLTPPAEGSYQVENANDWVSYVDTNTAATTSFRFEEQAILLRLLSHDRQNPQPFNLTFRCRGKDPAYATLLGRIDPNGDVLLPAILHIPGQGTLRLSSDDYNVQAPAVKYHGDSETVTVSFLPTPPGVLYKLEVINPYPNQVSIGGDSRFDGFRRCWLNTLQLSSKHQVLANHAGSEVCGLCYHEYSEIAMLTGPLAEGVSGPQLIRDSLNKLLSGKKTYGMPGYGVGEYPKPSLDTWPSLLIAAHNYYQASGDAAWVSEHIDTLIKQGHLLIETDSDSNGLLEYHQSGNRNECHVRPANWWDCINFGHEDAYSNALAYRAFRGLAQLAKIANRDDESSQFNAAARKLKQAYYRTFYNPDTGMLAGWKSRDGQLHDYAFTFIQGLAITYGVVDDKDTGNRLMDATLKKLKEVHYDRYDMGLPGNLVVVPQHDYYGRDSARWGGAGAFGVYENGGASANHVYYTLAALYQLDRQEEADRILFPILKSFNQGEFQGTGDNGNMTNDWRAWDGTPWGYEGFLCDNYLVVKAVLVRNKLVDPADGNWRTRPTPQP